MEFVEKAQALLAENALYVGVGLVLALLLAGFIWYSMSRGTSGKGVLENQARVNMATTDVPNDAARDDPEIGNAPEHPMPSQEELEKQLAAISQMNENASE